jgi:serine/threonine-protein kinase
MLYLLATGQLPFSGKNPHEVLRRIAEGKFADPRTIAPGVDQRLARIISRALARLPDDRYPDVAPMADDLMAYLADGGLTDVRAELRAFFADPPGYERDLQPRLAAALSASAATQLRERRLARAMELWNRVLVFDPQNAEVGAALARLEGRRRLQRVSMGLALLAAVGVVSWATARRVQSRRRIAAAAMAAATPPAAPRPAPAPPRLAHPTAVSVVEAPPPHRVAPHPARARAEGHVPPTPAARTFTLGPTPQNVDVYLDGQRQFAYDPAHTSITIPWNADHVLELRSPTGCCFVERVDIGPDHPLPPDAIIARRLKWRPARVVVTTEPPAVGARVLVRDPNRKVAVAASRPGEEIDVPFFTDDEASKEVEISVDAGDSFVSDKIRVRAGQKLSHVVKLRPGAN